MNKQDKNQWLQIENKNGKTIGIAKNSTKEILEIDGLYFKDLNQNGKLDKYEDWRLPIDERLDDLVSQMSIEEIAGLMLYSSHLSVSTKDDAFSKMFAGTYNGKSLAESGAKVSDLSDQQMSFLLKEKIRHFLLTTVDSPEVSATWSNNLQAMAENQALGIPVNISSDPRHGSKADTEFNAGSKGEISKWPQQLGLAATFDADLVKEFGQIASLEYRALGIATALSPQIDLATEPRWMRFDGTFGESSELSTKMAKAYVDGFQTTIEENGYGNHSVNTMVKHWPGGGSGEAGRDAHFGYGKYAVYPNKNYDEHLKPFTEGAFKLDGGTGKAAAVMPYYTISYDMDQKNKENVGNAYNKYIITDLLREGYEYEGVVCTDWGITKDAPDLDNFLQGKPWGVEELSVDERHYKAILAGVDQFGGNNELAPVLAAYEMGVAEFGEEAFRKRMEQSAKRILRNIMQVGLFENPYQDVEATKELVGNPEFMQKGFEAQIKSLVALKNKSAFPIAKDKKVFVMQNEIDERKDWFGRPQATGTYYQIAPEAVGKYFPIVQTPEEADYILAFIQSPITTPYDREKGYLPISLQYKKYTAKLAKEVAIAEGNKRAYQGKENQAANHYDARALQKLREDYPDKKIIVVISMKNPTVMSEIEPFADGILVEFGVQSQAIMEILSGKQTTSGKLPFQLPLNMETVEAQAEDTAFDMEVYVDELGNAYDYGFGL